MEYKVVTASSPESLTKQVNDLILSGWKPVGSHTVVGTHRQNRYSGMRHMDTRIETEYSQTMIKE